MRNLSTTETPSLFGTDLPVESEPPIEREEKTSAKIARDFVRWCCSVGSNFRNSPDVTNLRTWMNRHKITASASDEGEILLEARRLFIKKIEQAVRKADVAKVSD
jgi:hypothetical protein